MLEIRGLVQLPKTILRHHLRALLALVSLTCGMSVAHAAAAQAYVPTGIAKAVYTEMNAERHAHHLRPLGWSLRLTSSAQKHDWAMAHYNTMSHQLPHEKSLGARITATTFPWRTAGENIGWNSLETTAGAIELERMMYNEKAPDNGHRLNILNSHFTWVGIYVYLDKPHHKLWLTEDFAGTT